MRLKKFDNIQLYHFKLCPFCIKVHIVMKVMGIGVACKNIRSNPIYKAELMKGGGKKQVPCIRIQKNGSERWLYESSDIIKYMKLECK